MQCTSQLNTKSVFRIELTLESALGSALSKDALKSNRVNLKLQHTYVKHELLHKHNFDGILTLFPPNELER